MVPQEEKTWRKVAEEAIEEQLASREEDADQYKVPTSPGRLLIQKGNEIGIYYVGTDGEFYDEVTNRKLDYEEVIKARLAEMRQIAEHGVYHKVPVDQCCEETGRALIKVRWLDINKGDEVNP